MRYTQPFVPKGSNYDYDKRGNRVTFNDNGASFTHTYGASPLVDRLVRRASNTLQSGLVDEYVYDADGRVTEKRMNKLSSETSVRSWLAFAYGPDDAVATDTVFKAVTVGGLAYNYFYDALGRRRAKVYPTGTRDEFFYDTGHQLLTDQGVNTPDVPAGYYVEDDYVWLDGRPVALVRGRFSTSWARESDSLTDCDRNSESTACGVYFPITDHIGKTVLMLNAERKAAGIADYDAFGHVNRMTFQAGTSHPYANNSTDQQIGIFQEPTISGTQLRMRALFGLVDTESSGGTPSDYVRLQDPDFRGPNDPTTGKFLTDPIGGQRGGQVWTPWVEPARGRVVVRFTSNAANCCPTGNGGLDCNAVTCTQYPSYPYYGVSMAAYEYQRYETGAKPFWTPLRFPGQYHDTETDLFENWNRYYDPSVGQYLQMEPMMRSANWVTSMAMSGMGAPAYAYAANNPISLVDPDGLKVDPKRTPLLDDLVRRLQTTACGRIVWEKLEKSPVLYRLTEDPTLRSDEGAVGGNVRKSHEMVEGKLRRFIDVRINPTSPHGTSLFTFAHELGHALDYRYGIDKRIQHSGSPCYFEYNKKDQKVVGRMCVKDDPRKYMPNEEWAHRIARCVTEGTFGNGQPYLPDYDQ